MRVTVHGHRPACLNSAADGSSPRDKQSRAQAQGSGEQTSDGAGTVQEIKLLVLKVKVHRRTSRQASLLSQQRQATVAASPPIARENLSGTADLVEARSYVQSGQLLAPEPDTACMSGDRVDVAAPGSAGPVSRLTDLRRAIGTTSRDDLVGHWAKWEKAGGLKGGNRREAVIRLNRWLEQGSLDEPLLLSGLQLTSLPRLPNSLRVLHAQNNRLSQLPESLPSSMLALYVQGNPLNSLPADLPASLQDLDARDCRLLELPSNLPVTLQFLDASNNRLRGLPESMLTRLGRGCEVDLSNNPLSQRVRERLSAIVCEPGYRGPRFFVSMTSQGVAESARPLADAVADWFADVDDRTIRHVWSGFADEEGAESFSKFLDRLGDTVNSNDPQFVTATGDWLSALAERPSLRRNTFLISEEATTSCEDRVSLTFNEMKKARLTDAVESGRYDQQLPDLIAIARRMFRLDKLEHIARGKAAQLRLVDEVEVYLAYQVQLRDRLDLPLDTPSMRFFGASMLTPNDLDRAEEQVKHAETAEFFDYLTTDWGPWQGVSARLQPQAHQATKDKLVDALAGREFEGRLQARLQAEGLENNTDARSTVGAQVRKEMIREANAALTNEFLRQHGLPDLMPLPKQSLRD